MGLGIGALVGILFAPKSGEETREYLFHKADEGREYAQKKARELRERAEDLIERSKEIMSRQKDAVTYRRGCGQRSLQARSENLLTNFQEVDMSGWVEAFIVIAAVAIVIADGDFACDCLFRCRRRSQQFHADCDRLQSKINPILIRVNRILEDSEDRIASIMGDAAEITRVARSQAQKVDRIFTEAIERLRIQILRADIILTGALEVIEDAGSKFRDNLWGPVQKASAVIRGIKVGLDFLRGQRRG